MSEGTAQSAEVIKAVRHVIEAVRDLAASEALNDTSDADWARESLANAERVLDALEGALRRDENA